MKCPPISLTKTKVWVFYMPKLRRSQANFLLDLFWGEEKVFQLKRRLFNKFCRNERNRIRSDGWLLRKLIRKMKVRMKIRAKKAEMGLELCGRSIWRKLFHYISSWDLRRNEPFAMKEENWNSPLEMKLAHLTDLLWKRSLDKELLI